MALRVYGNTLGSAMPAFLACVSSHRVIGIGPGGGSWDYPIVRAMSTTNLATQRRPNNDGPGWTKNRSDTATLIRPPVFVYFEVPRNVIVTVISDSALDVSWTPMPGATEYDVRRDGVIIATSVTGTLYHDTGLSGSTLYTYNVRAVR